MSNAIFIDSWSEVGIDIRPGTNSVKVKCPSCSDTRKNKSEKCLSVNVGMGVSNCHNCGVSYVIKNAKNELDFLPTKVYKRPDELKSTVSEGIKNWFKDRGIEDRTLEYFKISESVQFMYEKGDIPKGNARCMAFGYYLMGEHINTKFRDRHKRFMMVKDAMLSFYNIDAVAGSEEVAIQEGEIDTMTAYQCNVFNSVSVPNGASKGNQKLEYLDNCIGFFENKKKIIIATDNDEPGRLLSDELIRRLGRERCWTIKYPEGCKDTNEVLLKHGSKAVKEMYDNAQPLPLEGIFSGEDISERVTDIYRNGFPKGEKIGYKELDELISFRPGEFFTWTGVPGSGKSEFVDQVITRLAARYDWRCAIFSPEQQPPEIHAGSLLSKFVGEKMYGKDQMSQMKLERGLEFVNSHFFFMKVNEINTTIDGILEKARELILKKGINLLLIDPYNYIEHRIPKGYTETQYISEVLSKIAVFAKSNKISIHLIAHPTKIKKEANGKYMVPNMYDIAGSANFFNKTDNGIAVYRDMEDNVVTIYVQKVKFKFVGKIGFASFQYDIGTGRYAELGQNFESELDIILRKESQSKIEFNEPPDRFAIEEREPGVLTDFGKLNIGDPPF